MTVKELIAELQKENPDAQVIASNSGPIYHLEAKPGYYDGHTPMLIQDESKKPYYSIVGYKWDSSHDKVVLQCMNLEDCLYNCISIKKLDDFIIEGSSRYVEGGLDLKAEIRKTFKEWGKT